MAKKKLKKIDPEKDSEKKVGLPELPKGFEYVTSYTEGFYLIVIAQTEATIGLFEFDPESTEGRWKSKRLYFRERLENNPFEHGKEEHE